MNKIVKINLFIILLINCFFLCSCKKDDDVSNKKENDELNCYSDLEILDLIFCKIRSFDNYYVLTTGKTKASLGLINYTQDTITSTYYQNNSFYSIIDSESLLVSHHHKLYLSNDIIKYTDSDKETEGVINKSLNEYLDEYGKVPSHDLFFNYIINEDAIINSNRSKEDNLYILDLELDSIKAVKKITKQMKVFGKLEDEPSFTSVKLSIYFDEEFNVVKFFNYEDYKIIKKIVSYTSMNCHQELESIVYTKNYNKINYDEFF